MTQVPTVINPSLTGPDQLCSQTALFQSNTTLVWSATPASLFTNSSSYGSQLFTAAAAGAAGTGTITGTLPGACVPSVTKPVRVGTEPTGTYRYNASDFTLQGTKFIQRSGNYTYVQVFLNQPYNFNFSCDNPSIVLSSSSNTTSFTIPNSVQNGFKIYTTVGGAACSSSNYWLFVPTGYSYAAAPNPASNELAVSNQTADSATPSTESFEAELYDMYGKKVKTKKSDHGKAVFDVRDVPDGLYNLRVGNGKNPYINHIQIVH